MDKSAKERTTEQQLISQCKKGGITLVLGAGISIPRGIPNWDHLAKNIWKEVFPNETSPWDLDESHSPKNVPQFLPIVFELIYQKIGKGEFMQVLRKNLYEGVKLPDQDPNFSNSDESLAVLARLIVQEHHQKKAGRINAIITLNADDMLEQAVQALKGIKSFTVKDPLRVFARSTHSMLSGPNRMSIPIYHIHGFLPANHLVKYNDYFDHMLVFTDTQYWATSASGISFANRTMATALNEGCCIFIGLSMTDINLLRWLALRSFERDQDVNTMMQGRSKSNIAKGIIDTIFKRHFWIRPPSDDPSGFLSRFLLERGVMSVEIDTWKGQSFRNLLEACFPNTK